MGCLLDAEAAINIRTRTGDKETSLHLACEWNHLDCIRLLIRSKADVFAKNSGGENCWRITRAKATRDCIEESIRQLYTDHVESARLIKDFRVPHEIVKLIVDMIASPTF